MSSKQAYKMRPYSHKQNKQQQKRKAIKEKCVYLAFNAVL